MVNILKQTKELEHLRAERHVIKSKINDSISAKVVCHDLFSRLNSKKLMIQDSISQLESVVMNDIVA